MFLLSQVASAKAEGASELYGALDESALVAVGELQVYMSLFYCGGP